MPPGPDMYEIRSPSIGSALSGNPTFDVVVDTIEAVGVDDAVSLWKQGQENKLTDSGEQMLAPPANGKYYLLAAVNVNDDTEEPKVFRLIPHFVTTFEVEPDPDIAYTLLPAEEVDGEIVAERNRGLPPAVQEALARDDRRKR